ncbi:MULTISPECIES: RidA family protein [Pseudomonas]|jgi:2-iminobutanoate/2-iminopropanoate deaminase|uniref:Reactive intermediate/imine deaminase n=2 Tax=Pseudomonas TaxID=286 RepID=A0A9X8EDJ4_PSEPU|nr:MULTISPECIES: RidA family protein [Pseudomonas]KTC24475.1 enamine deaminase RidA [Pseudomonas putida]MBG8560412.1 RidA family protein [Pseudomonas qingdaonensis]MCO7503424.1 RidA family protein [Pseudomonas sp. VE 267-6A]MCO7528978.1 RidA family protein [Pseudomonas sp. 2]MCQ0169091.1 RidA family protein [Pseudomonas sp. S12(2018)]
MSEQLQRYPSHLPYPFSKAIRVGDFLFLSGQVPMDPQGNVVLGDIREQTEAVMSRIGETLTECGVGFDQVVKATVWLTDMQHFAGFNEVYKRYFDNGFPVRSTVGGSQLALGVDVEIEVQAWVGAR